MTNELREATQRIDKLREAFDAALARAPSFHEDFQQHRAWAEAFAWFVVRDTYHALTATTPEAAAQAEGRETVFETMQAAFSTQPVQAQGASKRVHLVCTGEVYEGRETYTRHEGSPPPLCDFEKLYTHPAPAVDRGLSEAVAEAIAQIDHLQADLVDVKVDDVGLKTYVPKQTLIFSNFVGAMLRWRDEARSALAASAPSQAEPDVGAMEYRGNTVSYIYAKKDAYAQALDSAWQVLREFGHNSDGSTPLNDMIRKALVAPSQAGSCQASGYGAAFLAEALRRIKYHTTALSDAQVIALQALERYDEAPPAGRTLTDAARDVLAERHRQIVDEGWTAEHDDAHDAGELSAGASAYAIAASDVLNPYSQGDGDYETSPPLSWPWDGAWWRPGTDPRRMLVKACALTLAEIERLDRAASSTTAGERE